MRVEQIIFEYKEDVSKVNEQEIIKCVKEFLGKVYKKIGTSDRSADKNKC